MLFAWSLACHSGKCSGTLARQLYSCVLAVCLAKLAFLASGQRVHLAQRPGRGLMFVLHVSVVQNADP